MDRQTESKLRNKVKWLSVSLFATLIVFAIVVSIGLYLRWYQYWPNPPIVAAAVTAPLPSTTKTDPEHLIQMQQAVLEAVATMNARAQEQLDFAIVTVGFLGAMVLGIFGFFGWQSSKDARAVQEKAEGIIAAVQEKAEGVISKLGESKREFAQARDSLLDSLRQKERELEEKLRWLNTAQKEIATGIRDELAPQLAGLVNYGMKMVEFTGAGWTALPYKQQLRHCQEAKDAIGEARVGAGGNGPLSFIFAREGVAHLTNNDLTAAMKSLEESARLNARKLPDRHYNLACAYVRISQIPNNGNYAEMAYEQLEKSAELVGADPAGSWSLTYFKQLLNTDADLGPIRPDARFSKLISGLPP